MRGTWVALMIGAVALAGCAGDGPASDDTIVVDKEQFQLAAGKGATLGVKGQFLQTVFLGAPEVDVETYCSLC